MTSTTQTAAASPPPVSSSESPRARARPLGPDNRRAMIIDAVIPIIIEHGRSVTTRQLAEAAGLGEGTIFRAFGDKETLLAAAAERYFDPEPLRRQIAAIDPARSLEEKVNDILVMMRSRMLGVHGMMHALGMVGRPPFRERSSELPSVIGAVIGPDLDRLNVPPDRVIQFIRLVAFASVIPTFADGREIPTDELTTLIIYGIAGHPPAEGRSGRAA